MNDKTNGEGRSNVVFRQAVQGGRVAPPSSSRLVDAYSCPFTNFPRHLIIHVFRTWLQITGITAFTKISGTRRQWLPGKWMAALHCTRSLLLQLVHTPSRFLVLLFLSSFPLYLPWAPTSPTYLSTRSFALSHHGSAQLPAGKPPPSHPLTYTAVRDIQRLRLAQLVCL